MKQEVGFNAFCDGFSPNRENNFSYEGKRALFDYLEQYEEDCGQEIELDIVALCCEYVEYENVEEYLKDYETDIDKEDYAFYENEEDIKEEFEKAVKEEISNKTTLIEVEGEGFIIGCY